METTADAIIQSFVTVMLMWNVRNNEALEYDRATHGEIKSPNTAWCYIFLFDDNALYVNINLNQISNSLLKWGPKF